MQRDALQRRLLALIVSGAFLGVILLVFGFNYSINDDTTMVAILNGSYTGTPDGHAIFVKYPLSWVIKTLYTLTTAVSWYAVTMLVIYWLAMGFLLCQLLARFPRQKVLVCALFVGGMSLLWVTQVVRLTFSTCGAYVAAAAALSYALIPREEDLKVDKLGPLLILFWLSYCIRDYFALASLLFLAIVWLSKYYDRLLKAPKCWLIPVISIAGLGLCVACNTAAYSSEEWQAYLSYNDERSYVQDYAGIPGYDDNQAFYDSMGITKRERKAIVSYTYLLVEDFGPETFHQLYEYVRSTETPEPLGETLKDTLKTAVKHYLLFDKESVRPLQIASLIAPAGLLLTALFLSVKDRRHYWVFPLMILFGLGCMWLYICYNGRYPLRVALSLRIITVFASLTGFAVLLNGRPLAIRLTGTQRSLTLAVVAAAVLLGGGLTWKDADGHYSRPERASYYIYADEHPEALFLRENSLSYIIGEDSPSTNVVATGSWLHYSPLYQQKLERLGYSEITQSTLLEEDVYLIASSQKDLRKMLGLAKDAPLEYEVVAQWEDICVYRFISIG